MLAYPNLSNCRRWPWAEVVIWAGAVACVIGFVMHRMWLVLPLARFGETLLLAALAWLLAWPLRRWRGWAWADALAAVWTIALLALTGVAPALAVATVVAAAAGLGSLLVGRAHPATALLTGAAMLAGVAGWLLPLPVHRWWVHGPLMVLLIAVRHRALRDQASAAWATWRAAVDAAPRAAAWAAVMLGLASAGAWLPTMQFDDLAYHLGLPWQLMVHGRYALDPSHQVWTLSPWAGDVLQALPQLLARQEARSGLNGAWLLVTAAGLWRLGAVLGIRPALRWGVVALFASLPLTATLLGGMQTETLATAAMVGLAALILDTDGPARHRLLAGALLFGLLCALKPLHGLAALPLLAWAAWRSRGPSTAPTSLRLLAIALLLVLAVAGSSVAYSWIISGNPVLPLFNGVFRSPYFAASNFGDARWHQGFDADLFWDLTFDTEHYLEAWDGGIGFVLVVMSGAWLLALRNPRTRALTLCATAAMALPLAAMQYARYAHPAMVLLLPALVLAVQTALPAGRSVLLVAGLCLLNLAFQTNAQWMLHTGAIKRSVGLLGRDRPLLARYAPERVLAEAIRTHAPSSGPVLDLTGSVYAEFAGRGRTLAWYDPGLEAARTVADTDASGAAWADLLRRERIAEVILRPASLSPAQRAGLAQLKAQPKLTVGDAQWWRVPAPATP